MGAIALASSGSLLTNANAVQFGYTSIAEAFPAADPGIEPFGTVGVFQIRQPLRRTKGGVYLTTDNRATEYYNTQIAKVISVGPLAFKSQEGGKLVAWPEGAWFKPGDFVRVPKYGGDRFAVTIVGEDYEIDPETGRREKATVKDEVIFALFKVKDVLGRITGDPLAAKAFLD